LLQVVYLQVLTYIMLICYRLFIYKSFNSR